VRHTNSELLLKRLGDYSFKIIINKQNKFSPDNYRDGDRGMDLLKSFQQYIKQQHLFQQKDKLLLAVSGGVDSVVLCELCKQAGYDFVIAHCNFQLRGEESERDEQFVRALAEKYKVEIFIEKFETEKYATEKKISIQVAARDLRYTWFLKFWMENYNSLPFKGKEIIYTGVSGWHVGGPHLFILTAHHADDNVETLLMNFFKGTGIKGLHGILPKENMAAGIIRPLLFAKKEAIKLFATENNLSFVEDSSNALNKYTRNYFRNELIPGLQKVFPQVEDNLLNNIERFKEIELLYRQAVEIHKKKLVEIKGEEIHIPVLKLLQTKPLATVLYEIISEFGFTSHQVNDVINLLQSESGKYIQSANYRVIRNRKWLIISPFTSSFAENILIEAEDKKIVFIEGKLQIEKHPTFDINHSPLTAQLDAAEIKFPLLLRKWKQGDYFYPLGMQKKKKLSRFFIDQKLSLTQKEKAWVIESNKKILWVVGMRIDDRFKITSKTKEVLQISLS
jgi:tRNA(Ile)-lysidine synthase